MIEASKIEIEAQKLQLYAELEMEDEAEQEVEGWNVIKTLAQVQEKDSEDFSFSAIDAEGSEEEEEECVAKKPTEGTKGPIKKAVCIPCSPHCIKMLIGTQKRLKAGEV